MRLLTLLLALVMTLSTAAASAATPAPRERLNLDQDWRFHLGNEWGIAQNLAKAGTGYGPASNTFSDASWRLLDLPHDWAIETPFDPKADTGHGSRSVGPDYPKSSVGWYRKVIQVPASDKGKRLWLEFDGVYRVTTVFVNGWFVGRHEGGYDSFRYDITDVVNPGQDNVVSVLVDASQFEGWFYEGAGIYRHVWLVKTPEVALAPDGVFVYSTFGNPEATGPATLHIEAELHNPRFRSGDRLIENEVLDAKGNSLGVLRSVATLAKELTASVEGQLKVDHPALWTPETPSLYTLVTRVIDDGVVVDEKRTTFGIRTATFDANRGFLLNGKPYVIKGTCNHQDHAGVGAAIPDRLQEWRLQKLKEMGSNAYRSAHNAPTPELLEICDRIGLLVMDESRQFGSDALQIDRLTRQVKRDRNHASVLIWSVANEEFTVQSTEAAARVAVTMQEVIKKLDPSRPITYNAPQGNEYSGINSVIEVRGWSYRVGTQTMDAYHAAHPEQPNVGSEQGSTTTTRGIYEKDPVRGYNTAYDIHAESWSNTAKEWWGFFKDRPWLSGGFVWTGFDYRGEPTPYGWPCISSHFGIFDTCGFPKDNFYNYKAWWSSEPVLHLMPHWNWPGKEGKPIEVNALTNCDEVELFLNGKSLGRKTLAPALSLAWTVTYEPGVLSAKGYKAGREIASAQVTTTGASAAVALTPDRSQLTADGVDLSVITVAIRDAKGQFVPTAMDLVNFELTGPGRILGVGNGDPSCHEEDTYFSLPVVTSRPVSDWKWKLIPDHEAANLPELALDFDDSAYQKADVSNASGPLGLRDRGVFRAVVTLTEQELSAEAIELRFGKLEGEGPVYVNGTNIGRSGDPRGASVYNVKKHLKPGRNVVVVALANWGNTAGVNDGVDLRFIRAGEAPSWKRSVFNGLAQILVQAGREPGVLKLKATGKGLETATVEIVTTR